MKRRGVLAWLSALALADGFSAGPSWAAKPSPCRAQKPAANAPITTVLVPRDRKIEVAFGPLDASRVIVYLHGVCGDPLAFQSWAKAASEHATLISLRGDLKCEDRKGRYQWSYDFVRNNHRISAAIAAANAARQAEADDDSHPAELDPDDIVLMGYSQGAHRVEGLAQRFSERFPRVAIMAPARAPVADHLKKASRVLLVAGERDAKKHIQEGRDALRAQGTPVNYLELPGAGHGEYGPEAQTVMAQGLDWLYK